MGSGQNAAFGPHFLDDILYICMIFFRSVAGKLWHHGVQSVPFFSVDYF